MVQVFCLVQVTCLSVCAWLGAGGVGVNGREDRVWALPILEEQGDSGICVGVLVAVVWVVLRGVGGRLGPGSGLFVLMAGPGIYILC